jgi:protein O-GlcNAc transferase
VAQLPRWVSTSLSPLPILYRVLGRVLQRRGNTAFALVCFREAARLQPGDAQAFFAIGKALLEKDDPEGASDAFKAAIRANPRFAEAHNNLGVALEQQSLHDDAAQCYREALRLKPHYAAAHNNLGNVHLAQSRVSEAEACYAAALAADPDYVEAHNNMAIVLAANGKHAKAEACCRRALQLRPDFGGASNNLGNALRGQGLFQEAMEAYRAALVLNPELVEASLNLAMLQGDTTCLAEAVPYYERQLKRNPASFQVNNRLGLALQAQKRWSEARPYFEEAIRLNPQFGEACSNLANNYAFQSDIRQALAWYRKAIQAAPTSATHQSHAFYRHYGAEFNQAEVFAEIHAWANEYAAPLRQHAVPHANLKDAGRKLRIGYVSRDFRRHSVAYFIEPILQEHDRATFEVYCYANLCERDTTTERLKAIADHWRETHFLNDAKLVDMIRADGIDILVDLSGHTSGNRLLAFAHKPAPVQVTYLGYPDSTGMEAIDYRITDSFADPRGMTERYHAEELVRLTKCFLLYAPPQEASEVGPLPCLAEGRITFGSFNNVAKMNERVILAWSNILHAVPDSRILLKSFSFSDEVVKDRYLQAFMANGIAPERVALLGFMPDLANHLDVYHQVDIALDTFPYNGTTTTCESLWMGVPVIALEGSAHVARVGTSLLGNLGLSEYIGKDVDDYVALATKLANDRARLQDLRSSLRPMMLVSPLMDKTGFTRDLERAYRVMWERWCENGG